MEEEIRGIDIKLYGITPSLAIRAISSIGNAHYKLHHTVEVVNPHIEGESYLIRIGGVTKEGKLQITVYKEVK